MNINRYKAGSRHTDALATELEGLQGPCVGCQSCTGLCAALIEALVLPEIILSRRNRG